MTTIQEPLSGTLIRKGETASRGMGEMGQEQFLTLMLAQLKNQDPLKPLEPGEFLGQLAQFSTVTGVQGMQSQLSGMVDALRASQTVEGASLIGRGVLSEGNIASFDGQRPVRGTIADGGGGGQGEGNKLIKSKTKEKQLRLNHSIGKEVSCTLETLLTSIQVAQMISPSLILLVNTPLSQT